MAKKSISEQQKRLRDDEKLLQFAEFEDAKLDIALELLKQGLCWERLLVPVCGAQDLRAIRDNMDKCGLGHLEPLNGHRFYSVEAMRKAAEHEADTGEGG